MAPLRSTRWFPCGSLYSLALLLMVLCLSLLIVNIYELRLMQADHAALHSGPVQPLVEKSDKPVVWVQGQKLEIGYMKHVFNVFERIGYATRSSESDWDVLWSHDYPFKTLGASLGYLRPHQKVNHFPGSGVLTNKVYLVSSDFQFIPKAFQMPNQKSQFLEYVNYHPEVKWVQKNNNHRGVKITTAQDLNLDAKNSFVQMYVDDVLLIDGRRFDIGLYVTLTSVDPLRVYVHQGEWLIRFCSKDYEPFDPDDLEKYVITDDYIPLWEMPSLAKFYQESDCTRKAAMFSYLRGIGLDPDLLNRNLESAIRDVFYSKESNMSEQTSRYPYRNFFEMVRFDFLVGKDLNVYLMEVNMSPNLSSEHFSANKLLYEQVVFSLLSLVGISSSVRMDERVTRGESDVLDMQVSSRDIRVYTDNCTTSKCNNCQLLLCRVCAQCMNKELESILKSAYLEHMNKCTWQRIIPKPPQMQNYAKYWNPETDDQLKTLTRLNQIMLLWFNGKCSSDATWCS